MNQRWLSSRPQLAKMFRDLRAARTRVVLMVIAVAISLVGVGAMLTVLAQVGGAVSDNYERTKPASATLDVTSGVDDELLSQIRRQPGIADATIRQTVHARLRIDGEWHPMLLFVIDPDDPLKVVRFDTEKGSWPPAGDGIFMERSVKEALGVGFGDKIDVAVNKVRTTPFTIIGTTHDAALAPAEQEKTGYGYVTPQGLSRLGVDAELDQLKIVVGDKRGGPAERDQAVVDARAEQLVTWLTGKGKTVNRVEAPPVLEHPHQNQADTIMIVFLGFAIAALVLSAVVVATTLGGMLAQQTRQIGVLKTVGATTWHVLCLYLGLAAVIAAAALALAIVPAVLLGEALGTQLSSDLNVDIIDTSIPAWVPLIMAGGGLVVPLLVALVPVIRAARTTVRGALDSQGVDSAATGTRRLDRWLSRLPGRRTGAIAMRNAVRRRGRLVLTLALLAAGGALFAGGVNTANAWDSWVDDGLSRRTYDAEMELDKSVRADDARVRLKGVVGVTGVETLLSLPATTADDDEVEIRRTYPDGGHGSFSLIGISADTRTMNLEVESGRWLRAGDAKGVVLNQNAAERLGDPKPGDRVRLGVEGRDAAQWRVVGVVSEVASPARVYAVPQALDPLTGKPGQANMVRLKTSPDDSDGAISRAEKALSASGMGVENTIPTDELGTVVEGHVGLFIGTLIALAVLMAIVGVLGLASTMGMAITERTRELGVMQAIGATPRTVRRIVLLEGILIGITGAVIGVLVGLPVGGAVGAFLGELSFNLPLPFAPSYPALVAWPVLAVLAAVVATTAAALRASRLSVRETLSYE